MDCDSENKRKALSFGLNEEIPAYATVYWGARWIFPNDMVHDRQDFIGFGTADGRRLQQWLDGQKGAIGKAMAAVAKSGLRSDENRVVTLFEDETGIVKGNPKRSHGYLYVCGFLKEAAGTTV
jgi:hypothetical protein